MRFFRPLLTSRLLYPDALFRLKTKERKLVLTFDDGPDPASTLPLIGILDKHNVKAIFFCTGSNAEKFPDLVNLIRSKGHTVGNHGFDHLNGWRTSKKHYTENARKSSAFTTGKLFRPPYGIMRLSQYRELKKEFRIVLWDVMPYDFDKRIKAGKFLDILKKKIRPGSVIVLHDSENSSLLSFLDSFLTYSISAGYSFITEF
jgi:peptidoglycan/xylan/chitin deacetylase (PgdA/CDA1 family)